MHYGHSHEKAKVFAEQANTLIDKCSLPRRPDIYELFYAYVTGEMPEVTRALDKIFAKKLLPNEDDCNEIYNLHISDGGQENAMLNASDTVQDTIGDVKTIIAAIQVASKDFGTNMSGMSAQLSEAKSLDDVTELVKTMMVESSTIVTKNQELETQLERSSTAMDTMSGELEKVRKESLTDGLTGLPNRKNFDRTLDKTFEKFNEDSERFSLLVLDIDHFKSFNDTYGHQVGDRVLMLLARVLQDHATENFFPARFGGEEFVAIASKMSIEEATKAAESIREGIASKEIINKTTGERLGQITVSIGVAEIKDDERIGQLVERADKAMYAGKKGGRNQVVTDSL